VVSLSNHELAFDKLRANGINPFWVVLKETTEKCGGIARSVAVARRSRSKLGAGFLAYARNKLSNLKRDCFALLAMTRRTFSAISLMTKIQNNMTCKREHPNLQGMPIVLDLAP